MNDFKNESYFCYYCGNNHTGKFYSNCKHYICKKCYIRGNCILCNKHTSINWTESNHYTKNSKKRKFKDISLIDEFPINNKCKGETKILSVKLNKVIDDMMKDFELLDNSIVEWNNEHDFPFHDLENINQVLKRKKLS